MSSSVVVRRNGSGTWAVEVTAAVGVTKNELDHARDLALAVAQETEERLPEPTPRADATRREIHDALRREPQTASEIAQQVGMSGDTVKSHLASMPGVEIESETGRANRYSLKEDADA